ncbi:hypothetical protein LCGC14_0511060, partial [marine sediment metagenome]
MTPPAYLLTAIPAAVFLVLVLREPVSALWRG